MLTDEFIHIHLTHKVIGHTRFRYKNLIQQNELDFIDL